jgi:hypothetical protein
MSAFDGYPGRFVAVLVDLMASARPARLPARSALPFIRKGGEDHSSTADATTTKR